MKKVYLYIGLFLLLIIVMFILESSITKPVDWTPSFNETHKKPWGTFIVHSELNTFFPNTKIEDIRVTPFEHLAYTPAYDDATYIFIDQFQIIDEQSVNELFKFVEDGNKVFISGTEFPYYLLDSLNLYVDFIDPNFPDEDSVITNVGFYNKNLKTIYNFGLGFMYTGFVAWDTITSQALGYQIIDTKEYANFVRVNYGDGSFYFHSQPYAFTNYHLLKDNHCNYASEVFAYLDNKTIIYACSQKDGFAGSESPLRFIFSNPALSFAWRLGIAGLLLFVIFTAKRRQRVVPIITSLPNTSEEFARTIGNLYLREGNAKDIVTKKITFFLEKIRTTYLLNTDVLDEDFKKRLHQKTGVDKALINKLIGYIIYLKQKDEIDLILLIKLNDLINKFNRKTL